MSPTSNSQNTPLRVVVGLDEGRLAEAGVDAALMLATRLGARLTFVHATSPFRGWSSVPVDTAAHTAQRVVDLARDDRLAYLKEKISGTDATIEWSLEIATERPVDALLERAEEGADLIVLGGHSKRGLLDFGGTARGVTSSSPCPVWVQPGKWKPIEHILAAVSSDAEDGQVLEQARRLAHDLGARVTIMHCFVPPEFAYQAAGNAPDPGAYIVDDLRDTDRKAFEQKFASLDWSGIQTASAFVEGRPAPCILERAADLICMGTRTRSRLAKTILGSTAYEVLKDAEVPVVVCPL